MQTFKTKMDHSYTFDWFLPFFIPYHLDGYKFIVFVVQTLQDLPEGALPDDFKHFKPVGDVVVQHLDKQDNRYKSVRGNGFLKSEKKILC